MHPRFILYLRYGDESKKPKIIAKKAIVIMIVEICESALYSRYTLSLIPKTYLFSSQAPAPINSLPSHLFPNNSIFGTEKPKLKVRQTKKRPSKRITNPITPSSGSGLPSLLKSSYNPLKYRFTIFIYFVSIKFVALALSYSFQISSS